jgi:peptidoglycan hydrolase-like protein with peptidoglycan-binding domain
MPETDVGKRKRRRRGRKTALALAVLAAGGAAAVIIQGRTGQADGQVAVELPPNTAEVTRQTLNDAQTADGELGYGPATTVVSRLPGTITSLPGSGSQVERGQAMYKVDDKAVTLMYGQTPAYRALTVGSQGPDVRQLEENLSALGYSGFTVDDEYTSATATAFSRWQESQGLTETGVVELGRVVFAPGAIRVDSLEAEQGQPVAPGQKVLTYTGTAKAVTVDLDVADQRLAKKGAAVRITLPRDTAITGRVDEVSTVIEPGDDPKTKVEVVVGLEDQQAAEAYALASVQVTFTADERKDVLTVPVAALLALQEGGFGVEVVEGSATRYVPVRTGLFADGRVEISGDAITDGTVVGTPK